MTDPLHELSFADLYQFARQMEETCKVLQLEIEFQKNMNVDAMNQNQKFVKSNADLSHNLNAAMHRYRQLELFANKILQTHPQGNQLITEWNKSVQAPPHATLPDEPNFLDIDKINGKKK